MDKRKARAETTRQAVLESAGQLFAKHGYEGTSLEMLGRAAGINKALIQYHFGGKKGLYSEVLRQAPDRFVLGADCTVPGDIDWDNLRTAIDTAHGYRGC